MKANGEIIKNACNLSSRPDILLDFISDQIVTEILQKGPERSQSHMSMLAVVMPKEPPEGATFDPLRNQYVSYVASAEDAFVESKLYICVSNPNSKAMMWKEEVQYVIKGFGQNKVVSIEVLLRYIRKNRPRREFFEHHTKISYAGPKVVVLDIGGEPVGDIPVGDIMKQLLEMYPPPVSSEKVLTSSWYRWATFPDNSKNPKKQLKRK